MYICYRIKFCDEVFKIQFKIRFFSKLSISNFSFFHHYFYIHILVKAEERKILFNCSLENLRFLYFSLNRSMIQIHIMIYSPFLQAHSFGPTQRALRHSGLQCGSQMEPVLSNVHPGLHLQVLGATQSPLEHPLGQAARQALPCFKKPCLQPQVLGPTHWPFSPHPPSQCGTQTDVFGSRMNLKYF